MRLHAEEHDVGPADLAQVADDPRFDFKIAVRADDPQPFFLHRPEVRPAGEQHDVTTGFRQARADIAAHGARSRDRNSHEAAGVYAFATTPRWILPVAVRGIASVM